MSSEPIAITGIGCRLPGGGNDPRSLWTLLANGVDAIREVPADRWSIDGHYDPIAGRTGKSITRWAGFIDGIDRFDPAFFGISPREAAFMDPQQRLLLETAWEAIDDAGQSAARLRGSATGVFVGISTHDYEILQSSPDERPDIDIYSTTGSVPSIAANRISYCFDLRGPSLAIDTACSSSLIAAHLACEALRAGDCSLALVGGVNALIATMPFVAFSRMSMLSPTGRCRAFDASADGFVRAEGAGVVVLRPLGAALADGDRIYAVIRATAANQDGRTNGITVPSGTAQAALVRAACARAGVSPAHIAYVEAHGTGTPVGDPIEATALGESLSGGRSPARPCVIGSIKTNVGHLEAGAGVAGLIKLALVLQHGQIPPNLHFDDPNPNIDFERLKIRVPRRLEELAPGEGEPTLAAINSFGFGGANAHAVLQAPPARPRPASSARSDGERPRVLAVSAASSEALREAAARSADRVLETGTGGSLDEICRTAGSRRTHHAERLMVCGTSRGEMAAQLRAFAAGESAEKVVHGRPLGEGRSDLVFVFSGQGPQWWGMGRELARHEPEFLRALEACDRELAKHASWRLLDELGRDEASSRLAVTAIAQPAIFALQVALAALWESWGIRPAAVVGHSVGEVAAAHAAGVLSLADAARVIFERGRCMDLAPERGRMLAAALATEEAREIVAPYGELVSVGALNAPRSVTLSGSGEALEEIAGALAARDVFCRFLQVSYAFHSAQMDPVRSELQRALGEIPRAPAVVPMISTVTGGEIVGDELDAAYWWKNVRQTVRFAPAIEALGRRGFRMFVELSAHPALTPSVADCLKHQGVRGVVVPSLRRQQDERSTMLAALAALHVAGAAVDFDALSPGVRTLVSLPAYPWQRERFWHESPGSRERRLEPRLQPFLQRDRKAGHPAWEGWVDVEAMPYLRDHVVQGHVVFPAAGYVEVAAEAAESRFGAAACRLEDVDLVRALVVPEGEDTTRIEIALEPAESRFTIASTSGPERANWTLHCSGKLREGGAAREARIALAAIRARCRERVSPDEIYRRFGDVGLEFGPAFRGIAALWRRDGEALARIEPPPSVADGSGRYRFHPAALDACFQVLSAALPNQRGGRLYLPVHVERLTIFSRPSGPMWSHVRLVRRGGNAIVGDIRVLDDEGETLARIEGFRCQAMRSSVSEEPESWIYESRWEEKPLPGAGHGIVAAEFLASPTRVAAAATAVLGARQKGASIRARFLEVEPDLDRLCAGYVTAALCGLGWAPRAGNVVTVESLMRALGIEKSHRGLVGLLLDQLSRHGVLARTRRGWRVRRRPVPVDCEVSWRAIVHRFPALYGELVLLRRAGKALGGVLAGKADPLAVLAPGGSLIALEQLYQDAPSFADYNHAAAAAAVAAIRALPEGRRLRVLEVGGGTGGTTAYVLPRLPSGSQYVFTDVSASFFARAEQKFFDHPGFRCQLLDIERSPVEQGLDPHAFDLVFASDALHATRDVAEALANVRALLAPRGLLVAVEIDRPTRWTDLVFGLTPGWWRFRDRHRRPAHPLLDRQGWRDVLAHCGFAEIGAAGDVRGPDRSGQTVLIARAPGLESANGADAPQTIEPESGSWLVLADPGGEGERLAAGLRARGASVTLAYAGESYGNRPGGEFVIDPGSASDFRRLLADLPAMPSGIVHLWSLAAAPGSETTLASLAAAERTGCVALLHLVQALAGAGGESPRVFLVTRGSQPVAGSVLSPAQAPVWALGRVVQNEHRRLRLRMIDLDPGADGGDPAWLARELRSEDGEDEVAWRGTQRFVNRLSRGTLSREAVPAGAGRTPWRLEIPTAGALDSLRFVARPRRPPGEGEVEIEVRAAALNFRDVMKALGIYPIETDEDLLTGDECAGVVVAVGPGVRGLRVGDRVLALGAGCFASHLTAEAWTVGKIPASLSFAEAATIPVVFLTVWYALHHLGRMRSGDKVLVQAATGGVGLAALQAATLAGAEIYATAGSVEKRELLRALGVEHVMDSRTLDFADDVMAATGGRGVDLVLNSLAGEAIAKGIDSLAPHGRFLEIGKRDIYADTRIGLRAFRKSLALFAIDMVAVNRDQPDVSRRLMREILDGFRRGRLHALPHRVMPASEVGAAFRFMAKAHHTGKVVVSMDDDRVRPVASDAEGIRFRADASYLVTGGLGGFGLALAAWLVENGARSLVLVGRGGASTSEARRAVAALRRRGARVLVVKADVGDPVAVGALFARIARSLPRLAGVFHAAMVLDDGVLAQIDAARFHRVMEPKVHGAWNLHEQSLALDLECFVLFSSVSSIVGAPAQGNYVAANGFLDALAHYRRGLGLPALTVNWGTIAEVGYVARHEKVAGHLGRQGIVGIAPADALRILGDLLRGRSAQVGVIRVDWQRWANFVPNVSTAPRYGDLMAGAGGPETADGGGGVAETIFAAPAEQRSAMVVGYVREQVGRVLRTAAAKLDVARPLAELGVDSLMAFELVNRIEAQFSISLPTHRLAGGATIERLASVLLEVLSQGPAPDGTVAPPAQDAAGNGRLVVLRAGDRQAPVFCIHPAGGLANIYKPLAERLPGDSSVVALQSRAISDGVPEHDSIDALASDYAARIVEHQPDGPYRLLGFSLGGLLSLAIARVLEDRGAEVAFVGLVDSDPSLTLAGRRTGAYVKGHVIDMWSTFAREFVMVRQLDTRTIDAEAAELAGRVVSAPPSERGKAIVAWLEERGHLAATGLSADLLERYFALFDAHAALVEGFALPAVRARVVLWHRDQAANGDAEHLERNLALLRTAALGGLTRHEVRGGHYDLMYPPLVDALAAGIGAELLLPQTGREALASDVSMRS